MEETKTAAAPVKTERRQSKKRAERTAELRRHILDVSVELFIEQGYEKTTTRQIIHKAGILNGSLYNIFKNKEEIFSEAIVEAFWGAIDASEKFLPDATILEKIGFPMLLPVYVSSKSVRMAELLAVAGKKWETMDKIVDLMMKWIEDKDGTQFIPAKVNNFRFLMYACMGAQSNIIELYARNPGAVDPKEAMKAVAVVILNVFQIPHHDIDNNIERIYNAFDSNDLVICGVHI